MIDGSKHCLNGYTTTNCSSVLKKYTKMHASNEIINIWVLKQSERRIQVSLKLVQGLLEFNLFFFKGGRYKQIRGTPIGATVAPTQQTYLFYYGKGNIL